MATEESSISIINRNNGSLTGENAQAVPVKLLGSLSWVQYILIGFIISLILMSIFVATIKKQVVAVEVSGRADTYQIFEIK